MKTHFKKLQNPNYLGSWDFTDKYGNYLNRVVTIDSVKTEEVFDGNGGKENLPVVHFKECKPMVLNSTNIKTISRVLASNFIEEWSGGKIELTVKKVKAFGDVHDAIRVVLATPKETPFQPAVAKLKAAKTLTELQSAWQGLTKEEMRLQPVIQTKEELKNKLK